MTGHPEATTSILALNS